MAHKAKNRDAATAGYEPTPREHAALSKIHDWLGERAPGLMISQNEGRSQIRPDHPNKIIGMALLMEALGTTDVDFYHGLLAQLAHASGGDPKKLNFMLSVVKGVKPRDQIEAMLAAQMAAVQMNTMEFARSLADAQHLDQRDSAERTFTKLTRTFVTQMEAIKRYRTGGEQTVTVQHVNVSEGGQAIVGNVTHGHRRTAIGRAAAPLLALTEAKAVPMPIIKSESGARVPLAVASKKK